MIRQSQLQALQQNHTYVKIDLDAISENFRAISQKAGVPVMAVIKADAYGHGAVTVARHLEPECGFFGVSSLEEAQELRNAGIRKPILILGHTPAQSFSQVVQLQIRPAIFCYEDALALSREAQAQDVVAPFHFAVDTGMSRLGFQANQESARLCAAIAQLPGLHAEGLFSHFATADCPDLSQARAQAMRFDRFYDMLQALGLQIPIRHLDNSAGIMNFGCHYEMVRSGIVTYGMYPSKDVSPELLPLKPALSWHSYVSFIKWLKPGRSVGYGGTYVTTRPTLVATIPVGYADGYRRSLSGSFSVLIRGRRAPILGKICMDQLMVDVTDVPNIRQGDEVVLVGTQAGERISMEELSQAAGTFNYEFVCGISRRVPRIYLKNGAPFDQVHYLLAQP